MTQIMVWRKPSRVDVFGQNQNYLIETYSDGVRRGLTDIEHMSSQDVRDLLDGADAAVVRDPSQVSGKVLSELDTSSYSRAADGEFGYRGIYTGDEKLVEGEVLNEGESLQTGHRGLME